MAQNISIWGATYSAVPSVTLPKQGGGTASFTDVSDTTATASDVASGKYFYTAAGVKTQGTSSGGGGSGVQIGTAFANDGADHYVGFDVLGNPTSFIMIATADASISDNQTVVAVVFDGTNYNGQTLANISNAQVSYLSDGFTSNYSSNHITIGNDDVTFNGLLDYKLIYTYDGTSSDIHTANVQVGSGATSITFPSLSGRPIYWSCIFKSNFSTSSGYQRVIAVANDGDDIEGLAMDSSAKAQTSWTASYSGGSLTISSQGTNNGGYFHQPGYYQLTYAVDDSAPEYQTKTVTPTTSQQSVTPDSGYDALEEVIVNAIPSEYIIPTGSISISSNGTVDVKNYASAVVNVSGGGGTLTVKTATTTHTSTTQTLSFSSLSAQPKYWFCRVTSQVSSSGSTTYYYITDLFYDGTNIKGNSFRIGSTRRIYNITSGISQSYSSGTLTITGGSSTGSSPGQFYGASGISYELVYIY